jgi:hypothetical protein
VPFLASSSGLFCSRGVGTTRHGCTDSENEPWFT